MPLMQWDWPWLLGHATRLTVGHAGRDRISNRGGMDYPEGGANGSVIGAASVGSQSMLLIA
ncbi:MULTISPECIES: hypothetical protein [Moorena]|uniref:hypothetical protein n=1 Tax=Moorena TaxID=1155738 RepID=UPI0011EA62C1|nr:MULTISPECIES: hypothetical protein [Moorena]NEO76217.1 hypothetical protein [Moorena sp. SIO4G3]